ncbi:MAG: class I SAM-dependent methyltransferase [Kiritimatiellales bacterium]
MSANQSEEGCYPLDDLEEMGAGERYTDWVLSGFNRWIKGEVCEVGAGTGSISTRLKSYGLKRHVMLEPDQKLFSSLTKNMEGAAVFNNVLSEYLGERPEECFDVFLYVNVLEHIERDQDELDLMYSFLRPGGVALIFVPALQALFSENDRRVGHWRRYSKNELKEKIERVGFKIEEVRYFDFIGTFVWFLACRLLKLQPSAGKVGLYDRLLVPLSRWTESRWTPIFGKNVLAIAIKPETKS